MQLFADQRRVISQPQLLAILREIEAEFEDTSSTTACDGHVCRRPSLEAMRAFSALKTDPEVIRWLASDDTLRQSFLQAEVRACHAFYDASACKATATLDDGSKLTPPTYVQWHLRTADDVGKRMALELAKGIARHYGGSKKRKDSYAKILDLGVTIVAARTLASGCERRPLRELLNRLLLFWHDVVVHANGEPREDAELTFCFRCDWLADLLVTLEMHTFNDEVVETWLTLLKALAADGSSTLMKPRCRSNQEFIPKYSRVNDLHSAWLDSVPTQDRSRFRLDEACQLRSLLVNDSRRQADRKHPSPNAPCSWRLSGDTERTGHVIDIDAQTCAHLRLAGSSEVIGSLSERAEVEIDLIYRDAVDSSKSALTNQRARGAVIRKCAAREHSPDICVVVRLVEAAVQAGPWRAYVESLGS
jgi:hypothetical protein